MIRFEDWVKASVKDARPALVVGKGPSSDHVGLLNLKAYRVFTLNDAIRLIHEAEAAHFIDIEAFERCAHYLHKVKYIFMPDRPHKGMTRWRPIDEAALLHEKLRFWLPKIVTYTKEACHVSRQSDGSIGVLHFSAEGLFGVLGKGGVKEVRSVGIDGGISYSKNFSDLTPLENGRKSFDDQNLHLEDIVKHYGMRWEKFFTDATPIKD